MQAHQQLPLRNIGMQQNHPPLISTTDGSSAAVLDSNSGFERSTFDSQTHNSYQASKAMSTPKHLSAFLCINIDPHQTLAQSHSNNSRNALSLGSQPSTSNNQLTIPLTVPASLLAPPAPPVSAKTPTFASFAFPTTPKTPTFASLNDHSLWLDQWFGSEASQAFPSPSSIMPAYKYETSDVREQTKPVQASNPLSCSSSSTLPANMAPLSSSSSNLLPTSVAPFFLQKQHRSEADLEDDSDESEDEEAFTHASTSLSSLHSFQSREDVEVWNSTVGKTESLSDTISSMSMPHLPALHTSSSFSFSERRPSTTSSQGTKRSFDSKSGLIKTESESFDYPQKRKYIRGRQDDADDPSTRLARFPTDFDRNVEPTYELTEEMHLQPRSCDIKQDPVPYPGVGADGAGLLQVCNEPQGDEAKDLITAQEPQRSNDLYTPLWTRYDGDARQGWCRFCTDQTKCWYSIKRSQYMYHLQYCHGISSRSRRAYDPPEKLMIFNDRNRTTAGLCGECDEWVSICYGSTRKISWTAWYKHAHKCHNA